MSIVKKLEETLKAACALYHDDTFNESDVEMWKSGTTLHIELKREYEYAETVVLGAAICTAFQVSADQLSSDQWKMDGCETCDHGAVYTTRITVEGVKLDDFL